MNGKNAQEAYVRPGARSFTARKRSPAKWIVVAVLAIVLAALGTYYISAYRRQMEYNQYPVRYGEEIVRQASAFELEPWHVAAVVRSESSFREQALSSVGARGLMQIMPETGEWIAGKLGEAEGYTEENLYLPEVNLKYGCWYMRWLMDRYSGSRALATAAYHAGHGTVDKWISEGRISVEGETLVSIPSDVTGTYVRRVLSACAKYQELYVFDETGATPAK